MADEKTPEEIAAQEEARLEHRRKRIALMKEEIKLAEELSNKVEIAAQIRSEELAVQEALVAKIRGSQEESIRKRNDLETGLALAIQQGDEQKIARAQRDLSTAETKLRVQHRQIETSKKDLKIMKKRERAIEQAGDSFKGMLTSVTGISEAWRDTTWGALATTMGDAKSTGEALDNMKSALEETMTPANILGSTFQKMIESSLAMAFAVDEQTAAVSRATGAIGRYDRVIEQATYSFDVFGNSARQLGIGTDELGESIISLHNETLAFSKMSDEAQGGMITFTSTMSKLGVQTSATAESYDLLIGAFRMSSEEAEAAISDIMSLAMEIGIPPQKMADEFNTASKRLAAYGTNMISMFKKVSASAKALNMDTSTLLGIMEQFDTFEGAATAVGNLNAVLGGPYLNSIQMVRMNEEQRTRAMIEAMEASGRSFKDLGKYEKMAIANAAGISDMAEANKIFGQSLSSYDEQMAKSEEADKKQQDFNEAIKEMQTLGEKLKIMFMSLAVSLTPLFKALGNVVSALSYVYSAITGLLSLSPKLTWGLGAITAAFIIMNSTLMKSKVFLLITAFTILAQLSPELAGGLTLVAGALFLIGLANPFQQVMIGMLAIIGILYVMGDTFRAVGKTMFEALVSPINAAIWALNKLIDGANFIITKVGIGAIPNIDYLTLDSIPFFANGVTDFGGGPAIVGEKGPEMVTMGQGSNVVTNENVKNIMSSATEGGADAGGLTMETIKAAFVAAIQETGLATAGAGPGGQKTIIMKLNDREFGRAVYEKMDKKTQIVPK